MNALDDDDVLVPQHELVLSRQGRPFQKRNFDTNIPSPPLPPTTLQAVPTPAVTQVPLPNTNTPPTESTVPSPLASSTPTPVQNAVFTFTTSFPASTVIQDSTTFTLFNQSLVFSTSEPPPISTSLPPITSSNPSNNVQPTAVNSTSSNNQTPESLEIFSRSVCLGAGLDAASEGLLATLVLTSVIGLVIWLVFAIVRPRFRQVYAVREWFVHSELRPKPLGPGLFAFLSPPVPLVPAIPRDVDDAGRSASRDAELFPSDEQLTQRILWVAFLMAAGWTILALAGALPLYLVTLPCNSQLPTHAVFTGGYSTLQDLSLLRLLRLFDETGIRTTSLISVVRRADENDPQHARIRLIVLTVIAVAVGLPTMLWKILREFNALVAYRNRWLQVKCEGKDLGWLSVKDAPGFQHWGEKRLKNFVKRIGLSSGMDDEEQNERSARRNDGRAVARNGTRRVRRRDEEKPLNRSDDRAQVDIQSLFSISDTQHIALLIDERDEILENLEIAETRYISSFQITTPDPSIADFEPPPPPDPSRPYISRPLPLTPAQRRGRRRRVVNRAYGNTSLAPTSFVAPSSYYKVRSMHGLNGGDRLMDPGTIPSFSESFNSRIIGSRFLEINRNSAYYGRLPLGGQVVVDRNGELGPSAADSASRQSWIPDPRFYGPNWGAEPLVEGIEEEREGEGVDEHGVRRRTFRSNSQTAGTSGETQMPTSSGWDTVAPQSPYQHLPVETNEHQDEEEWVDLEKENRMGGEIGSDYNGLPPNTLGTLTFGRRRQPKLETESIPATRRETFPLRREEVASTVPPPHLRLQHAQPFVRPLDGLNFDDLGEVYEDITNWRSRLKAINAQIAEVQRQSYDNIAEGRNIRGWLIVGHGLRHIPGIQLIEGRAKEDIRWDVLQNERTLLDKMVLYAVICIIGILLAIGLTAVAGLAVSPAPDVAHYLSFLQPLQTTNPLAGGIATVLVPAVAATVFIMLAVYLINYVTTIHGSISRSGNQLLVMQIVFHLSAFIGTICLTAIGGILFALHAFSSDTAQTRSIANGAIYITVLILAMIITVAIIIPGLLLLQPLRLLRVLKAERRAVTPRQRFRAVYPQTYDPSFAIGSCALAIMFASTFSLIFPFIAPAVAILLLLSLISHRFLIGYVYARTRSQTGGLLHIWLLRRFGTLLSFQPVLLGLILLSRRIWIEGGVLVGAGVAVVFFVELYTSMRVRAPGTNSLSPITRDSLAHFASAADSYLIATDEGTTADGSTRGALTRGSMASVLEMMSMTLAVQPSAPAYRGPIPLQTETLDDLTATERAARTHPDAPPRLPPLPFTDHAEDMAGILYAPELTAPPPIIWLPRDSAEVARSEAADLKRYHNLDCTLDVRVKEDVLPRRSSSSRRRRTAR